VDSIEGLGVPSLIGCKALEISGPVQFAAGVILEGKVVIENSGSDLKIIPAGTYQDTALRF
jgi:UTP--glucose-1-phosphate uridylyltransferase